MGEALQAAINLVTGPPLDLKASDLRPLNRRWLIVIEYPWKIGGIGDEYAAGTQRSHHGQEGFGQLGVIEDVAEGSIADHDAI